MVYFTAPSYGQKAFFDLAVPALSDGQIIVLMPGNYGTLALKAALREAGKDVLVAETDNLPYACAATEPGVVNVRGIKKAVTLAAFPAGDYAAVEAAVDGAFCTGWRKGENVLATSMSGVNTAWRAKPCTTCCRPTPPLPGSRPKACITVSLLKIRRTRWCRWRPSAGLPGFPRLSWMRLSHCLGNCSARTTQ